MRRMILWLAVLPALAGCGPQTAPPQGSIRNPEAMISSAALFDPARFGGAWQVAASVTRGCGGASQHWTWDGRGAWQVAGIDCTGPTPALLNERMALSGPGGRITPKAGFGGAPIWVLWVDQDYRVAVLGTPGGQWAVVLTRPGMARGDLLGAAREVLDFNGYDLKRLGG